MVALLVGAPSAAFAQSEGPARLQSQGGTARMESQDGPARQSQGDPARPSQGSSARAELRSDDPAAADPAAQSADAASAATRAETPEAAIEQLYRGLVEAAGAERTVEERYRRLDPVVASTHDLPYIAELAIRREWDSLSADERQRFVAAFQRLSVMTYASRFGALKPGMFKVTGSERVGGDRAQVEATLTTASGEVIPFQYLLHDTGGGWKIINILADNVSDLALKRAEYREVLEKGGVEDLIRHVEQQADDAARGGEVKYRK